MLGEKWKESIVKEIVEVINPDFIMLFGSHAKGTTHSESDVDLAYFGGKRLSSYERFIFTSELANLAGCEVDLVDISQIDTVFTMQVFEQGVPIYILNEDAFTSQRIRAYSMYAAFSERRKSLIESIKMGGSVFGDE